MVDKNVSQTGCKIDEYTINSAMELSPVGYSWLELVYIFVLLKMCHFGSMDDVMA